MRLPPGARQRLLAGALGCCLLAGFGCGDDDGSEVAGEPVPFRPRTSGATPFGDVPWPSDLYLGTDGKVGNIPGLERVAATPRVIADGLARLDGFGRSTGAIFFVDSDVDPGSLPRNWDEATAADASVFIADVDVDSPASGTRYPAYAKFLPTLGCISVIPVPGVVLPPGVRHAAVLTTRVRATSGERLVADAELERIARLRQRATAPERLYGAAIDRLVDDGNVARASEVASLAVFTTSKRVFELPSLRAELQRQPEPELLLDPAAAAPYPVKVFGVSTHPSLQEWLGVAEVDDDGFEWPGGDNPSGIAHDEIAVVVSAAFVAPSFLDPVTGRFERDAVSGDYVLADAEALVPVTLVLPRRSPPADGYPVVVHGHGLSNHRGSMLGIANELARAGFAMIGIDDVLHGARSGAPDLINNFPGSYRGADGIPDTFDFPVAFFAAFSDFGAMEDNFRQTVLDQASLVRLIRSARLDLSPLEEAGARVGARLDPTRIYWSGGSLGGIVGAMTIAVEPEIDAAALQVPGASFVQLISTSSAELASLVDAVARATFGLQGDEVSDEFHPVALLLGAATEAGDPIAYAPRVYSDRLVSEREPPDVMVTYAAYDEVLPNVSSVALIRALGLDLAAPNLFDLPGIDTVEAPVSGNMTGGRSGAAVQYMPANHGLAYGRYDTRNFYPNLEADGALRPALPAGFSFEQPIREHADQLVAFLESVAAGDPGVIEVTVAPRDDYDADGVVDSRELEQGTDPYDPRSN